MSTSMTRTCVSICAGESSNTAGPSLTSPILGGHMKILAASRSPPTTHDASGQPEQRMRFRTFRLPRVALGTVVAPLRALVLAFAFFTSQSDRFLSLQNFSLILQQVMVVGVIAIGQTLIILTAG